ncbi:MAG: phospholipase D-like domain-containing protein [Bacteroidales bacterium]|nr:phospholipase D-like domain-containing protein [Bacteroidales bacterium]
MVKEVLEFISQSVEDGVITNSEKKALRSVVDEAALGKRDLDWLRSELFKLARSKVIGYDMERILNWLERANKLLLPQIKPANTSKVFFSPGNDCLNSILLYLRSAIRNIRICVFTISDDRIAEAIMYAHKKGVDIKLITDDDKSNDKGSDVCRLAQEGIVVKMDNSPHHMHHKFAVVDEKIALTGSYNWTRSAAEYNQENLLVTEEKHVVNMYLKEFDRLWQRMKRI